jgi:hypothetical protein
MRTLQWARPELGPLPYCDNVAISEDVQTAWIFEGRGALTLGAHTAGHNWQGYGIGVFGNFDIADLPAADAAVLAVEWRTGVLTADGLTNLGTVKNPSGWTAWGHRDDSTKTCPGNYLYPLLADFQIGEPVDRNTKADDGQPALKANFDEAVAKGIYSAQTQPGGVAFNDEFATFLKRAGVFNIKDLIARVEALEASALKRGDGVELT